MGNFVSTLAVTGGEMIESPYGGSDGVKRFCIREKVNITAASYKTLVKRIPPRSKVSYCQLYNIDGITMSGTTGTATANRMGIVLSTASSMATGTAAYSANVLFIGGTTTASGTEYNGPAISVLGASTAGPISEFHWTSTSWGYVHLVPLSTSVVDPIAVATNTSGHFFFSTNTSATNTGAVAVGLWFETFPQLDVA